MTTTILTIAAIIVVFIILFLIFKFLMRLLLIVVFLFLAWITNPDVDDHYQAVSAEFPEQKIKPNDVTVDDYYVFSLTKINSEESKVIGAGAFTRVFIFGTLR
jgi:hypothetical protein